MQIAQILTPTPLDARRLIPINTELKYSYGHSNHMFTATLHIRSKDGHMHPLGFLPISDSPHSGLQV